MRTVIKLILFGLKFIHNELICTEFYVKFGLQFSLGLNTAVLKQPQDKLTLEITNILEKSICGKFALVNSIPAKIISS